MEELHRSGVIKQVNRPGSQRRPAMTVLLVEDDPETARAMSKLFLHLGFAVTHAANLEEAYRVIGIFPHWVVLDLGLGHEDGTDLLRRIRAEGMPIKVMVLTGLVESARIEAAKALGPDVFLEKPADLVAIAEAMVPGGVPEALLRPDSGVFPVPVLPGDPTPERHE